MRPAHGHGLDLVYTNDKGHRAECFCGWSTERHKIRSSAYWDLHYNHVLSVTQDKS